MATARKLPSGNWNCRTYSHTENGKKIYVSFTASTKQEAQRLAAEFAAGSREQTKTEDLTVKEAIQRYIESKTGVLSPSTINGYSKMLDVNYKEIENIRLSKLSTERVQRFISSLAIDHSPKTVSNVYGLLNSSVRLFIPGASFNVTLPKKIKKKMHSPSDEEVIRLYTEAEDQLKLCILLSAFASIRRGEMCAIKYKDIEGNRIYIGADMVKSKGGWVYKPYPKTSDSYRMTIPIPDAIMKMIGAGEPEEFVIKWKPDTVTKRFIDLRDKLGLNVRLHDMRHYFASIASVLMIPDTYTADFGGWQRGSKVLKETYQNVIDPVAESYAGKMNSHFDKLLKDAEKRRLLA